MPDRDGQRGARDRCARCGHPWSFHRKALGAPCTAAGCRVKDQPPGVPEARCDGFLDLPAPLRAVVAG